MCVELSIIPIKVMNFYHLFDFYYIQAHGLKSKEIFHFPVSTVVRCCIPD